MKGMMRLSALAGGRPTPAVCAARRAPFRGIFIAIFLTASFIAIIPGSPLRAESRAAAVPAIAVNPAGPPYITVAQDDDDSEEVEVPPDQIEKYVAVYKAMQRDRTLTVDQAAARQGLTVQAFRDLESRIQRDGAAQQRARDELQAAVQATPTGRPSTATPAP
jgi:hypothetical protein